MRKLSLLLFFVTLSMFVHAQDLAYKIPADASAVISVKAKNITDLMAITDLDKTDFGKSFLKNISKRAKQKATSIHDLGLDTKASAYYFYQKNDSVSYHGFLMPLTDASAFENTTIREGKTTSFAGQKAYGKDYRPSEIIVWDTNKVLFLNTQVDRSYFTQDSLIARRYGLIDQDYPKDKPYLNSKVRKDLERALSKQKITELFAKNKFASIVKNRDFLKSQDKKSVLGIWVKSIAGIYQTVLSQRFMRSYKKMLNPAGLYGDSGFSANVYLHKDKVALQTNYHMSPDMAKKVKAMSKHTLNKDILKHVDPTNTLGYISYAIHTEAMLQEYPKLLQQGFSSLYKQEMDLAIDALSLILDEKAIAKVIKGDALLAFSGLKQQEKTYTSYTYDKDYNRTPVQKTKKEIIPDLHLYFSSDKPMLLQKALDYAVSKDKATYAGNIYTIVDKQIPLPLHIKIENGIVALSSKPFVTTLGTKKQRRAFYKKHKQTLFDTNLGMYIDGKKIVTALQELPQSKKSSAMLSYLEKNLEGLSLRSYKIKNNTSTMQMSLEVPKHHKNGLTYLFEVLASLP